MAEQEKCPKCRTKLTFHKASYALANASNGVRCSLPDNYSCRVCGYYREEFPEKQPEPQHINRKHNICYPENRKSLGEPGWLKEIVRAWLWEIAIHRTNGVSWSGIQQTLTVKEPRFKETVPQAINAAFKKIVKEVTDERIRTVEVLTKRTRGKMSHDADRILGGQRSAGRITGVAGKECVGGTEVHPVVAKKRSHKSKAYLAARAEKLAKSQGAIVR